MDFNSHSHSAYLQTAEYLLRYLNEHIGDEISYLRKEFTDTFWRRDSCDRKSYSGFVMLLEDGPVAWESQKQSAVILRHWADEFLNMLLT